MNNLRQQLDIVEKEEDLGKQIQLMSDLGVKTGHRISLVKDASEESPYNCFMYAFNALGVSAIEEPLKQKPLTLRFGTAFVQSLIKEGLLQEDANGSIVIYFNAALPVHAGKMSEDGSIVSKWGVGHLWKHELWEVPTTYGDKVRRFRDIDEKKIVRAFQQYAGKE